MQAIRSKRTALENRVCSALWRRGLRFRRNVRTLPGCPDIAVARRRVAIFLDSCFWHGCPVHYNTPRHNADYWAAKLSRNRRRDDAVTTWYRDAGWAVVRVWEHDVRQDFEGVVERLAALLRPS
jgi:DNA mismatch endonuclease (patch repair protein)